MARLTKQELLQVFEGLEELYISSTPSAHSKALTVEAKNQKVAQVLKEHHTQALAYTHQHQQLAAQLETMKAAVEHLPMAAVAVSNLGEVLWTTPAGKRLLGKWFPPPTQPTKLPLSLQQWMSEVMTSFITPRRRNITPEPFTIKKGRKILTIHLRQQKDQCLLVFDEQPSTLSLTPLKQYFLTPREQDILGWVINGKTNPEIAQKLHIKVDTVNKHLTNIYTKLGVENRTAAVSMALDSIRNTQTKGGKA